MKKTLLFIFSLLTLSLLAQDIKFDVLSNAGGRISNVNSASFTFGQPFVGSITNGTNSIRQGFQQPSFMMSVPGCMDTLALNYDSLATIDDSSCYYYCMIPVQPNAGANILSFNFDSIYTSGQVAWLCGAYSDFTSMSTSVNIGSSHTVDLSLSVCEVTCTWIYEDIYLKR